MHRQETGRWETGRLETGTQEADVWEVRVWDAAEQRQCSVRGRDPVSSGNKSPLSIRLRGPAPVTDPAGQRSERCFCCGF